MGAFPRTYYYGLQEMTMLLHRCMRDSQAGCDCLPALLPTAGESLRVSTLKVGPPWNFTLHITLYPASTLVPDSLSE